jgi:hypothetical protein
MEPASLGSRRHEKEIQAMGAITILMEME